LAKKKAERAYLRVFHAAVQNITTNILCGL